MCYKGNSFQRLLMTDQANWQHVRITTEGFTLGGITPSHALYIVSSKLLVFKHFRTFSHWKCTPPIAEMET